MKDVGPAGIIKNVTHIRQEILLRNPHPTAVQCELCTPFHTDLFYF